jgi:carboxypeptidase Taq
VAVEAGLDRDHVAGNELLTEHPDGWRLVDLEADTVPEPVVEAVPEHFSFGLRELCRKAPLGEELGDEAVDSAPVRTRLDLRDRELERLPTETVPLSNLVRDVADRERTREIRIAGGFKVDREEIEQDDVVRGDLAGARVVADRRLRPVGDDHLLGERPMREEHGLDALLHELARQRLAVDRQDAVRAVGAAKEIARDPDTCLGSLLRTPDPCELVLVLPPAAVVEELLVDRQLDARFSQRVTDPEREVPRDRRGVDPEAACDSDRELRGGRVDVDAATPNLVGAELLGRAHLEPGTEPLHPGRLHRADRDDAPAVELRVDEGVRNAERHLVAKLGDPHSVADDQKVHGRRSYPARIESQAVDSNLRTLRDRLAEISDIQRSAAVLAWDQRVTMPPLGTEARAEALATLGRIAHERFVADEIGTLLEKLRPLEESLEYESDDASLIRVTRRDWEKQRRVPSELRAEMLRAGAQGHQIWVEARARSDFASFLPALERNLALKRRFVECFDWDDSPYTPLLDDYEPFMTTTEVAAIFGAIRPVLSELVRQAPRIDASFLDVTYPAELQKEFAERVLATLGFAEGAWRLDTTAHPFCTSFSTRDVRLTTRYHETGLGSLWSTMHEAGHGLYAHGIAHSLDRTPLAGLPLFNLSGAPSLGLNESQSRTWENLVGRSRPFWSHWYEPLQETFPEQLGEVGLEAFLAAINRTEPGFIRVEADETTYSLHIILRFELEQRLFDDKLAPKDLPEAWNEGMRDLLGVEVPDDARGVLQDTHWSAGGFGYFPTYALGNVISLQIWSVVQDALPNLDAQMEEGDLEGLAAWLRENLYSLGRKFTPKETIERLTGTPAIDPQPYLAYLREKLSTHAA